MRIPLKIISIMAFSTFIFESVIMVILHKSNTPNNYWIFIDSIALILFLCPILYFLIYKPLSKQADNLQESEEMYRYLVEKTNDLITKVDAQGKFIFANSITQKYLGIISKEIIGLDAFHFVHPDDKKMTKEWFRGCLEKQLPVGTIINRQINQQTNAVFWVHWTSSYNYDEHGNLENISGIGRDITDRKEIESVLQESEERFRLLMHQSPAVIELYNTDGLQVEVNEAYEKLWGFPATQTVNKFNVLKSKEVVDSGLIDYVNKAYAGEVVNVPIYRFDSTGKTEARGKGRARWLSTKIYPLKNKTGEIQHIVITHEDVSEIKFAEEEKNKLESQLRQTHKMEAIGTIAGGIAHDFNNILSIIINANEMAHEDSPEESSSKYYSKMTLKAAHRAKELVKQILAFSRQSAQELVSVKPHQLIKENLKLVRSTIPTTVIIREDLETKCGPINADPTQIHQLVMNLCTNASHAVNEKGVLEIKLNEVTLSSGDIAHKPELKPGQYMQLLVSDNGCGMDQETIDNIFVPFFTTKEAGEGTGMGLAVIHGIVESHGGMINVESEPGEGTTFHILFPIIDTEDFQEKEASKQLPQGSERILFVDDEEMLAEMGGEMLKRQGYQVTVTTSSNTALETFKSAPEAFDLVITDQSMPNMSGSELSAEFLKVRPDIPIILCTGYSKKVSKEKAKGIGIKEFILKPLDRGQLATTIRKVLNENEVL